MVTFGLRLSVFPTCVGMNRMYCKSNTSLAGVPHMRGDEPREHQIASMRAGVFPTCVGMNRHFLR